jgi:hypothetical protein
MRLEEQMKRQKTLKDEFKKVLGKHIPEIASINPYAVVLEGYDDCIVGIVETSEGARLLYSERKIIEKLKIDKTEEQAMVCFENTLLNGQMNVYSPVFLMDLEDY